MSARAEQFAALPPERLARWANFANWDTVWFPQYLGLQVEELRTDYARMRLPFKPEYRQPAGVVHGGVIASLIDTVVVPAIGSGYDEPRQLFTIDVALRFMAPVIDDDLIGEGWNVQRGRQIVFCDAEVRAASTPDVVAASASLTYKVSSKPQTF